MSSGLWKNSGTWVPKTHVRCYGDDTRFVPLHLVGNPTAYTVHLPLYTC